MKLLLAVVVVALASCTKPAAEPIPKLGATDFAPACDRSWNPYGDLPSGCDIGCARIPVEPTAGAACPDGAPCIDQPGCKLAVNRADQPRIDCAATFITDDGAQGCCVERVNGGSVKVEMFYECP